MSGFPRPWRQSAGSGYPWVVVGLLWFCGFFNYADRQALTSVFPHLADSFGLSLTQLGALGSAFMVVYALAAPLAGYLVDRAPRRTLVVIGLAFWSLICAATGSARSFRQLLALRAAEGLGESCYFPASMSLLADYHGRATRSRAMSLHQTSVYAGTALGGVLAGFLAERYGWRSPFWCLGLTGLAYSLILPFALIEPVRGQQDGKVERVEETDLLPAQPTFLSNLTEIVRVPAALVLLLVFAGANFVAMALTVWLTTFVHRTFALSLTRSALTANMALQLGSFVGVLLGGVLADLAARRPGGRIRVQAAGLLLGAPCILAIGSTHSLGVLVAALAAIGVCKGLYDASIFASVFDVVPPQVRGTSAGLMNTIGWTGGSLAPLTIGLAADRYGLGAAIGSTAVVYVLVGLLALVASRLTTGVASPP